MRRGTAAMALNLGKLLGAEDGVSRVQRFTIYLPDRDANRAQIADIDAWADQAVNLMAEINGGCTRLPIAKGSWVNQSTDQLITEDTIVIYSYLFKPDRFEERIDDLVEFLHTFGRETNQDYVMAEFSGPEDPDNGAAGFSHKAYFIPSKAYQVLPDS